MLSSGSRIGPYEVVGQLGAGGMGEVYEARDSKLNRNVALKILPPAWSSDPDRLARFRREAQVLASLNHPNIAAIYGLEDHGDTIALVMELVPGRTLAEVIGTGHPEAESPGSRPRDGVSAAGRGGGAPRGLKMDDALPIARQIATALEAAHEQGIVHRDLKPANIKITDDGTVKVLDFGLAKALEAHGDRRFSSGGRAGSQDPAAVPGGSVDPGPTMTSPAMTELGVILGTAGYMAPEQAKGKRVDRRADIWALGVVLFEMLAGTSLYRGETVTETIAHVITQPPSWDLLPASVPAPVRRLLRRCLEKDPRNRLQSAGDARIEIDEILAGPPADVQAPAVPAAAVTTPGWRRALPWVLAGVLLAALGYTAWPRAVEPARAARFDVQLTSDNDLRIDPEFDGAIAVLSPDGQSIAYVATSGAANSNRQLYLRPLDQLEATPLSGTAGAFQPFFSPSGSSLAFFVNNQLMRVAVTGGAPVAVTQANNPRGATWGPDDTIVLAAGTVQGLSRVPAAGGDLKAITTLGPDERTHRWPSFLPDGKHVIFTVQTSLGSYDDGTIEAVDIDTGDRTVLIRGGTFPRYVGGYLVYSRRDTLYAVRFDADGLKVQGDPRPVLAGLMSAGASAGASTGNGAAQFSIAANGTAVYLTGESAEQSSLRLAIVSRSGESIYEFPESRQFRDPSFSPAGSPIAVRVGDSAGDQLHLLDPDRGTLTRITFEGAYNGFPVWSHDGLQMAFASGRTGNTIDTYVMRSDGTGEARRLAAADGQALIPTSFSPDDSRLLLTDVRQASADLSVLSMADGKVAPFQASPNGEFLGTFSPDGKWVAYGMVDPTTAVVPEVFVRAYPDGGALRQVSTGGGMFPKWTRNGRELVYASPTGNAVMAVDVSSEGGALILGRPQKLFDVRLGQVAQAVMFDVTADGNRFVVLRQEVDPATSATRTHVTMVFNFLDEVRKAFGGQ